MSSTSTTTPPPADLTLQHTPPPLSSPTSAAQFQKTLHVTSLCTLFVAPALLLVPPRKLDLYTFSLCGAFVVAANHQTKARTAHNEGILMWLGRQRGLLRNDGNLNDLESVGVTTEGGSDAHTSSGSEVRRRTTPAAASVTGMMGDGQVRSATPQAWRGHDEWARQEGSWLGADGKARAQNGVLGTLRSKGLQGMAGVEASGKSQVRDAGQSRRTGQASDWKQQRMKEEREAAEEGKSTQEVIMDQIWSVWNWGSDTSEEGKRKWEETKS